MPKTFPKKSREETQLIEMAHRLGYAVTPISKSRQELARAIASRMVNRKGDFVYQSAAFSITNFPLSALESIFPDNLLTNDPDAPKTWSLPSVGCVSTILGPLLQDIPMCGGASRALKTASERAGVESWPRSTGFERLAPPISGRSKAHIAAAWALVELRRLDGRTLQSSSCETVKKPSKSVKN